MSKSGREELERLREYGEAPEDDPRPDDSGVLLSDQIKFYSEKFKLITPFYENNLKPAAYELTVGDEYYVGGKYKKLRKSEKIKLPPFEVMVIKTEETIHLPRFIIARWNIRVKWAYEGLLWVGGPQVDPGYLGHLFCPIYNLSDKPVFIGRGEQIAVIDFQKTTKFNKEIKEKWSRYPDLPKRPTLQDFGVEDFKSALFTLAKDNIDKMNLDIIERDYPLDASMRMAYIPSQKETGHVREAYGSPVFRALPH